MSLPPVSDGAKAKIEVARRKANLLFDEFEERMRTEMHIDDRKRDRHGNSLAMASIEARYLAWPEEAKFEYREVRRKQAKMYFDALAQEYWPQTLTRDSIREFGNLLPQFGANVKRCIFDEPWVEEACYECERAWHVRAMEEELQVGPG